MGDKAVYNDMDMTNNPNPNPNLPVNPSDSAKDGGLHQVCRLLGRISSENGHPSVNIVMSETAGHRFVESQACNTVFVN